MRKPLIDATGQVVNIIEIKPDAVYTPPDGLTMLDEHPDAVIGGSYDAATQAFTRPPEPEPEPETVTIPAEDYEALLAAVDVDRLDPEQAERIGVDTGKTARKQ